MFDDPLNIRDGGQKSQRPQASAQSRGGARQEPYNEHPDLQREEEEESWNPVSSFLMWVVAGGQQCCSMRDRTNPSHQEAAKKASESGRPPKSQFAEAGPRVPEAAKEKGIDSFQPKERSGAGAPAYRGQELSFGAGGAGGKDRRGRGVESDSEDSSPGDRRGWQQQQQQQQQKRQEEERRREQQEQEQRRREQQQREQQQKEQQQKEQQQSRNAAAAPSAAKSIPQRWEWPTWCLDFKNPSIDVWVVDDDTGGGRWVEGEPQSRVVDKSGRDAYLCAEYEWDGEYYAQDFGPQHVRRRGGKETVIEFLERQQKGGGDGDLDATRIAPGRRK